MPKKPQAAAEHVLFDVLYEDGTQRSNRKVPGSALSLAPDPDKAALAILEDQDRDIAVKSGRPPARIKSIRRVRRK